MSTGTNWTAAEMKSQQGRRVLITGANSGIGFHTALELARMGAEVIVPARTEEKTRDAATRICREVPQARVRTGILDLADLRSVRKFAAEFAGTPLDLLINNAGVMALPKRELTPDGYERQFATNFIGPFALTTLLWPAMKKQAGSRVVTVASTASNFGKIEFDNLQSERKYVPMFGTYSQSKLADLMFSLELQRRLTAAGSPVMATAAHPGYAVTNLQGQHNDLMTRIATTLFKPVLSQDAAHGALPTLFAAVAPEAVPGGYYGPDGFQEMKGYPKTAKVPKAANDVEVAKRLWTEAERLTGVEFVVGG